MKKIAAEAFYAMASCFLMVFLMFMFLHGITSADPQYSDSCEQRRAWEATGHDYVGIPPNSDHCL